METNTKCFIKDKSQVTIIFRSTMNALLSLYLIIEFYYLMGKKSA